MIDCRSQEGEIIGLIDAMIAIARTLRNYKEYIHSGDSKEVADAIEDLINDEDLRFLLTIVPNLYHLNDTQKSTFIKLAIKKSKK